MKKLLLGLLTLNISFTSITTVGCSYISIKEKNFINQVNKIIDGSSIIAKANIYSKINSDNTDKNNPNTLISDIYNIKMDKISGTKNIFNNNNVQDIINGYFNYNKINNETSFPVKWNSSSSKLNNNSNVKTNNLSGTNIISTLSLVSELFGIFNLPVNSSIINTINEVVSDPTFSLGSILNPILYSDSSSILDNSTINNFSLAFKPLIPIGSKVTNQEALNIAFFNIFYCLNKISSNKDPNFSKPYNYDGKLPETLTNQDFSNFISNFAQNIPNNISLSNISPSIVSSIFVIINYISRFFNSSSEKDIQLMTNNDLEKIGPTAFNHLFSENLTNEEVVNKINSDIFDSGIPVKITSEIFKNLFSNLSNGISLDKLLVILIGNFDYGDNQNYSSILGAGLDFLGGYLIKVSPNISPYWPAIISIIKSTHLFSDLEQNLTINNFFDSIKELMDKSIIPSSINQIINLLKNNNSFFNSNEKNDSKDSLPTKWNNGSISTLWNSDIVKNIIEKITSKNTVMGYLIIGSNLNEIINNLLNEIKISIGSSSIKLNEIMIIIKKILITINTKNDYSFNSLSIYNILSAITLNDPNKLQIKNDALKQFNTILKNNYSNHSIIAQNIQLSIGSSPEDFNDLTTNPLYKKYYQELENKSVLGYFLIEIQDKSLATINDVNDLLGINSDGKLSKNGYAKNLFDIFNDSTNFINGGILEIATDFINNFISLLNNTNIIYNDIIDPNYWIISNKKYDISKNKDNYNLPNNISYQLSFNDPDNNKKYNYIISISKTTYNNNNIYNNFTITNTN